MPLSPSQTRDLLASLGHSPRKALGQNFLVDGNMVRKSLAMAEVSAGDHVVEIGPGLGTLTQALLEAGAHVWAVERDATMAAHLRQQAWAQNLHLSEADALDLPTANVPEGPFKIVANLPYAIATPWLDAVLERDNTPSRIVVMLQRECADRFCAVSGTKAFGAISVFLSAQFRVAGLHAVPRSCFFPAPDVDSCLLHLERLPQPRRFHRETRLLIRAFFTQRRKQIGSLIARHAEAHPRLAEWLELAAVPRTCRPEAIPLTAYLLLNELLDR